MTLQEAQVHLTDQGVKVEHDGLSCLGWYVAWTKGESTVTLDATFTVKDLEAIITCMKEM